MRVRQGNIFRLVKKYDSVLVGSKEIFGFEIFTPRGFFDIFSENDSLFSVVCIEIRALKSHILRRFCHIIHEWLRFAIRESICMKSLSSFCFRHSEDKRVVRRFE